MSKRTFTIAATMPADAKVRLDGLIEKALAEHPGHVTDLTEGWVGDSFNFSLRIEGIKIQGSAQLLADGVAMEIEYPIWIKPTPYDEMAEQLIRDAVMKALA